MSLHRGDEVKTTLFGWAPIQWNGCPSRRKTPGLVHRGRTWEDPPRKLLASRREASEETTPAGVWTFALRTVKRQVRDCLGHPVRGAGSRPVPGTRTPGPRLETGRGPERACSTSPSSPLLPPLLFGKKKARPAKKANTDSTLHTSTPFPWITPCRELAALGSLSFSFIIFPESSESTLQIF